MRVETAEQWPTTHRIGELITGTLTPTLGDEPLAVRVGGQVRSVDSHIGSHVGMLDTATDLKMLRPFEFQNWVMQRVVGTHSPRKSGDMGIDGYSFFEQLPIQVKQSERVGRNVVDNFATAVGRSGKHMGYSVAFSFTRGAHEEARAKASGKAEIVLVKVADLIRVGELIQSADDHAQVPDLSRETPDLMRLFKAAQERMHDRALPTAPRRDARPGNKELIESGHERLG